MVLGGKSPSFLTSRRRFFVAAMPYLQLQLLFFVASSLFVSASAAPDCSASLVRFMPCVDYVTHVSGNSGNGTVSSTGAVSAMQERCCSAVREQLMIPAASIDGDNGSPPPAAAGSDNATCVCAALQAAAAGSGLEFGRPPSASDVNAVDYRQYILALPSACSLRFLQPCPPFTGPAAPAGSESNPPPSSPSPAQQSNSPPPPPSPSTPTSAPAPPDAPADQVPPPSSSSSMAPNREFASAPPPASDISAGNPTGLGLAPSLAPAPMDGIARQQQQQQSPPPLSSGALLRCRPDSQFWKLLSVAALLMISAMANNQRL